MLILETSTKFRKDVRRAQKRGLPIDLLNNVIETLLNEESLDVKHNDHALKGDYIGHRECHIQPDWLLIYKINKDKLILIATRTGTHADLFE